MVGEEHQAVCILNARFERFKLNRAVLDEGIVHGEPYALFAQQVNHFQCGALAHVVHIALKRETEQGHLGIFHAFQQCKNPARGVRGHSVVALAGKPYELSRCGELAHEEPRVH